ncbi:MAG: hypothetical protein ACSHX4_07935 [Opitutaceae bacterium]
MDDSVNSLLSNPLVIGLLIGLGVALIIWLKSSAKGVGAWVEKAELEDKIRKLEKQIEKKDKQIEKLTKERS